MKIFGSISELVSLVFRKDSQGITLRPNQGTTYTAARDIQTPPQDADSILVSTNATQTLTGKTISGASNTISNVNLTSQVTGVLPAANGGTGVANSNTLTYGANNIALTTAGATALTLPTSGTLATLAGTETLTNKSISGSANTLTNISLTTAVTGTLPIANGGTAATTKAAAMDSLSPVTTKGDLISYDGTHNVRVAVGSDGMVLSADSGQTSGLAWTSPLVNPMTTTGDLIVGGSGGSATRLAVGASGTVLHGGTTPSYSQIVNADVSTSAAIAFSKLAALGSAQLLIGNGSSVATAVSVTGDVTIDNSGITTIGVGKVTSGMILDGTIVNADIGASAAIDGSKLVAATASVAGAVTTAAQSFAGLKTFNAGVKIGASGATIDTATLNGTWTPTITDSTASGTYSGVTSTGIYSRIGNIVTASAVISWTNQSGATGGSYYRVSLPFTSHASSGSTITTVDISNITLDTGNGYNFVNMANDANQNFAYLGQNGSGKPSNRGGIVALNNTAVTRSLVFSLTYVVA